MIYKLLGSSYTNPNQCDDFEQDPICEKIMLTREIDFKFGLYQ